MLDRTNCFLMCKQIGLVNPTTVVYEGRELTTQGLSIEVLVDTWQRTFFRLSRQWICLGFTHKDFNAIQQRPLASAKSVLELFYDNRVICVDVDEITNFNK